MSEKMKLTQVFPNIDDVSALDASDIECMNEIKSVLEKHGKVNRFAMSLLHKHFEIKQDEVLLEDVSARRRGLSNRVVMLYPDFHSLFLSSLLGHGYTVLSNAIEPTIAHSLIANYDKSIGYAPKPRAIRDDIGIGMRKRVIDTKLYRLPELMEGLYEITRPAAQIWASRMEFQVSFPRKYTGFQKRCETVGQNDPVVVFRYECGSYVRFHSDPVGEVQFPFQFLGLLSDHNSFSGGDFLLRRIVKDTSSIIRLRLRRGDILVFPVGAFKRSKSGQIEIWQHAVDELKRSERFSISFLLNQAFVG